jgi:hypothetical protein
VQSTTFKGIDRRRHSGIELWPWFERLLPFYFLLFFPVSIKIFTLFAPSAVLVRKDSLHIFLAVLLSNELFFYCIKNLIRNLFEPLLTVTKRVAVVKWRPAVFNQVWQ